MKQKDIALIVVVSIVSAVISLLISNYTIGSPKNREQKAEVVEKITADFPVPDNKYFNPQSINPTQIIRIGSNPAPTPGR